MIHRTFLVFVSILIPLATAAQDCSLGGVNPPPSDPQLGEDITAELPNKVVVIGDSTQYRVACTYSISQAYIDVELPIKRFLGYEDDYGMFGQSWDNMVSYTDNEGYLDDQTWITMGNHRHISRDARITIAACDVDSSGTSTDPNCQGAEVDLVVLNPDSPHPITLGCLEGENQMWSYTKFCVDTRYLRFPTAPGGTGYNKIRVYIDTLNDASLQCWCTNLAFVSLEFEARDPVAIIHGITVDNPFRNFEDLLEFAEETKQSYFVPDTSAYGNCYTNAEMLKDIFAEVPSQFGTPHFSVFAHSKGGLDTKMYVYAHYRANPILAHEKLLSICTTGTPHLGSVLADIHVVRDDHFPMGVPDFHAADDLRAVYRMVGLTGFFSQGAQWLEDHGLSPNVLGATPGGEGIRHLTTEWCGRFARRAAHYYPSVKRYTFAGDADENDDDEISSGEAAPYPTLLWWNPWESVYRILGSVYAARFQGGNWYLEFEPQLAPGIPGPIEPNDLLVRVTSARGTSNFVPLETPHLVGVQHSELPLQTFPRAVQQFQRDFPVKEYFEKSN